jgi:phosphatidylglycerophosphatase A
LWLVPATLPAQACAFVLFRFFDITKPAPIAALDARLKNGLGVMADDLLAAFYALLVFALGVRLVGL